MKLRVESKTKGKKEIQIPEGKPIKEREKKSELKHLSSGWKNQKRNRG